MASELSKLIEDQLRSNGLNVEDGWQFDDEEIGHDSHPPTETTPLFHTSAPAAGPEAAHQTLMGALRVEARVKEQNVQKNLVLCQRQLCVGGGIAIVLVIFLVLVILSNRSRAAGTDYALLPPLSTPLNHPPSPSPLSPPPPVPHSPDPHPPLPPQIPPSPSPPIPPSPSPLQSPQLPFPPLPSPDMSPPPPLPSLPSPLSNAPHPHPPSPETPLLSPPPLPQTAMSTPPLSPPPLPQTAMSTPPLSPPPLPQTAMSTPPEPQPFPTGVTTAPPPLEGNVPESSPAPPQPSTAPKTFTPQRLLRFLTTTQDSRSRGSSSDEVVDLMAEAPQSSDGMVQKGIQAPPS